MQYKLIALTAALAVEAAGGTFSGMALASFDNPVTSGYVYRFEYRSYRYRPTFYDNGITFNRLTGDFEIGPAVYSGFDGVRSNTATARWGAFSGPLPAGTDPYSTAEFKGASFDGIASGETFLLGSLTFTNGTSTLDSIIFGATLTITPVQSDGSYLSDPLVLPLFITTTWNSGGADFDMDVLATVEQGLSVYEGASATFDLYGQIVTPTIQTGRSSSAFDFYGQVAGGPQTEFVEWKLNPSSVGRGVVGMPFPLVPVPEPASLLLAGGALVGLAWLRHR